MIEFILICGALFVFYCLVCIAAGVVSGLRQWRREGGQWSDLTRPR